MELHNRIRMLRLSRNLTQAFVADELGIDVANYSRMERGETKISIDRMEHLSMIFEVEINTFFSTEEEAVKSVQTIDLMNQILIELKEINKKL